MNSKKNISPSSCECVNSEAQYFAVSVAAQAMKQNAKLTQRTANKLDYEAPKDNVFLALLLITSKLTALTRKSRNGNVMFYPL
jgi:hypothetical protein